MSISEHTMPPLPPNVTKAGLLRSQSGWNNGSLSRRDNRTRGLLSTRVPQGVGTTGGGIPNPSLGIGRIGEATPRGATGSWRPISLRESTIGYGAVYYSVVNDPISALVILGVGRSLDDEYGRGQAVNLIGNPGFGNDSGALLLQANLNTYEQTAISTPSGLAPGDRFGESVTFEDDGILAGAPGTNSEKGKIYLSLGIGPSASWSVSDSPAGLSAGDRFGSSVIIDNNSRPTIVGAPGDTSDTGVVYKVTGGAFPNFTWAQIPNPSGRIAPAQGDEFGFSMAGSPSGNDSGKVMFVGAPGNSSNTGALYYTADITAGTPTWVAVALPTGGIAPTAGDRFGASVAWYEDGADSILYVGAPGYTNEAGRIYYATGVSDPANPTWAIYPAVPSVVAGDKLGSAVAIAESDDGGLYFSAPGKVETRTPGTIVLV